MIRVRFAPSPTGELHIGNARTALFNWLFARHHQGKFILRIEDTDVERSKESSVESIMSDLRWLGLEWDEGPDIGGEFGPYMQSMRKNSYTALIETFLRQGKAYPCYCSEETLLEKRKKMLAQGLAPRYDNACRSLGIARIQELEAKKITPVIRFKVPEKMITVRDVVRGEVNFDTRTIGDFVIARSNTQPTFHLTVSADDASMKITHVIRGEAHLSNTPKHIALLEAMGADIPVFAHMSMTLSPEGGKLSKRVSNNALSWFRDKGYLPDALCNYMALLGWSPPGKKEIVSREEMIETFDLEGLSKAQSIFAVEKLDWINSQYIAATDLDKLVKLSIPFLKRARLIKKEINDAEYNFIKKVVGVIKPHLKRIEDVVQESEVFFVDERARSDKAKELFAQEKPHEIVREFLRELEGVHALDKKSFESIMAKLMKKFQSSKAMVYQSVRAATTGVVHGPELVNILPLLGKERVIARVAKAIHKK